MHDVGRREVQFARLHAVGACRRGEAPARGVPAIPGSSRTGARHCAAIGSAAIAAAARGDLDDRERLFVHEPGRERDERRVLERLLDVVGDRRVGGAAGLSRSGERGRRHREVLSSSGGPATDVSGSPAGTNKKTPEITPGPTMFCSNACRNPELRGCGCEGDDGNTGADRHGGGKRKPDCNTNRHRHAPRAGSHDTRTLRRESTADKSGS